MQVKDPAPPPPISAPAGPGKHRAVLGQLSDMDLRLLQVFKSVVECGGMSAAELELNIGTSTVSRHIKDLEARLGLTLCRRGRAGFALTAEGQRVYDETLRLLASVRSFRDSVDDIHSRMGGQLAVAVFDKTASNPAARIHQAIAAFTAWARTGGGDPVPDASRLVGLGPGLTPSGDDFLAAFYRRLVDILGLKTTLPAGTPAGVHACLRTDGARRFLFVSNWNRSAAAIDLGPGRYSDLIDGRDVKGRLSLDGYGSAVLEQFQ